MIFDRKIVSNGRRDFGKCEHDTLTEQQAAHNNEFFLLFLQPDFDMTSVVKWSSH